MEGKTKTRERGGGGGRNKEKGGGERELGGKGSFILKYFEVREGILGEKQKLKKKKKGKITNFKRQPQVGGRKKRNKPHKTSSKKEKWQEEKRNSHSLTMGLKGGQAPQKSTISQKTEELESQKKQEGRGQRRGKGSQGSKKKQHSKPTFKNKLGLGGVQEGEHFWLTLRGGGEKQKTHTEDTLGGWKIVNGRGGHYKRGRVLGPKLQRVTASASKRRKTGLKEGDSDRERGVSQKKRKSALLNEGGNSPRAVMGGEKGRKGKESRELN